MNRDDAIQYTPECEYLDLYCAIVLCMNILNYQMLIYQALFILVSDRREKRGGGVHLHYIKPNELVYRKPCV